jgi:hypothetical protein
VQSNLATIKNSEFCSSRCICNTFAGFRARCTEREFRAAASTMCDKPARAGGLVHHLPAISKVRALPAG